MTEILKPCPFCGGVARVSEAGTFVICTSCDVRMPLGIAAREAARNEVKYKPSLEVWNRRVEQAGWIKTSERLPAKEEEVLVYDKGFFSIGEVSEWNGSLKWWYCDESAEAELNEFPYWMPLPELPEEVSK